jgi:membrane peptidoglycan carboxypeptidase
MRSPQFGPKVYALAMFVVVSVLAGLLVAGLAVPAAAIGGTSAKFMAQGIESLPAELTINPVAAKTVILMADGTQLAQLYDENRTVVPLDQIAPIMRQAQVAIEDTRFYQHGALDLKGTLRALVVTGSGSDVQGGSTLTQQYIKQVRIEAAQAAGDQAGVLAAQEQTLSRKVLELRYAVALEAKYSKDEILNRYLNIAYYGDGTYGVEAAAKHYFGVSAKDLTLAQAAMLAGLTQNPVATDPVNHPVAAIDRRDVVINRMLELGLISATDAAKAKATTFDSSKVVKSQTGCVGTLYPFMCDYVVRSLEQNPALGATVADRKNTIYRGGLVIKTQIDQASMDVAQQAVSSKVRPTDPVISTMVEVQPGTGLIIAMAQSRPVMGTNADAGETFYNYAVSASMGGAEGFQAGSTFKAFTIAAALDRGVPVSKTFVGQSPLPLQNRVFRTCDASGADTSFKFPTKVGLQNEFNQNYGTLDMRTAAAKSVNTYFVQLEALAGICQAARMATAAGAQASNGDDLVKAYSYIASFTLGVAEVTPLSMADAYATMAARGVHCDPIIVSGITSPDGKPVATQSANCTQVMRPEVADGVNYVFQAVMQAGGTGANVRLPGGRPQAGKTGTTDSHAAVWFNGYTPNIEGVAMVAVDKSPRDAAFWAARGGSLSGLRLSTGWLLNGSGSGDAGDIWTPAMTKAVAGLPPTPFTAPPDSILHGTKAAIPSTSGMSASQASGVLTAAGFTVSNRNVYDNSAAGTYIGVTCDGFVGGSCFLNYSQGPRPGGAATPGSQPS